KALHNPVKGQELARDLLHYGHRIGIPLLIVAALATISGFAFLNQGLYGTGGADWYSLKESKQIASDTDGPADAGEGARPPDYADFLAYTLINVTRLVDLVDVANTYNYAHITYVRQGRWPASTLLMLFKLFMTMILVQQIIAAIRQYRVLGQTIEDFWNPHQRIHERASKALPLHGTGAVQPLLASIRPLEALSPEQRKEIPRIVADIGANTVPILVKFLDDPNEHLRAVAVRALGHLEAVDVLPHLKRINHDPSDWVRLSLADTLGLLCDSGALRGKKILRLGQPPRRFARWWQR